MRPLLRAVLALLLLAVPQMVMATPPNVIVAADYAEPTTRYPHGVLGDDIEWGALRLTVDMCVDCESRDVRDFVIRLPEHRVFEDTAPRLVDLDGDGSPYVVVVESDARLGARLAIYNEAGFVAGTPFIGTRNRWLAPVGAADLDGDGVMELAYVDRPHLAKTLRVWRWRGGTLDPVAEMGGLSNHRIGERDIAGGIRTCANVPEMIVATADWSRLMAVTLQDNRLRARDIGAHEGRKSFAAALGC